jgi:hypothetical protein
MMGILYFYFLLSLFLSSLLPLFLPQHSL